MRQNALAATSGRRLSVVRSADTAWPQLVDFALDVSRIGAWDLDVSTRVVHRSPQYDRLFGYESPLPKWTHEMFLEHVVPEDRAPAADVIQAAIDGDGEGNLEFRIRRTDGEIRWIWAIAKHRLDSSGQRHIAGVFQDITERKSSEEALRVSDERLKKAFVSVPDAFSICTFADGEMVEVNQGFESIFGFTAEEAIGKTSYDLDTWVDYDQRRQMIRTLESEGVVHNLALMARRKDGSVFPAVISAATVGTGQEALMVAIVKDLTEVRRAERLLRLTQFSVDNAADSVFWADRSGRLVYISEATCRSLGYSPDELKEMTVFQLDLSLTDERWSEVWEEIKAQGTRTVESLHRRKDGTVVAVEVKANYVVFESEAYNCVFARDISSRKEAEKQVTDSLVRARASEAATIRVLSSVTEMRDPYTAGHQKRVAEICVAIADILGMPLEQKRGLETAALLHDVGKVSVPIEILACPGQLSAVQTRLVEGHVLAGYEILSDIAGPSPVAQIVLQHHERLDGSGYPVGLKGSDILLEARILAVADTAEAMSSDRPYRPSQGRDAARRELEAHRGTLYDSDVVDAYLAVAANTG
jgi:PAS domain S-box-containing protein/putative nucleotidyltransferase with HDIG domain